MHVTNMNSPRTGKPVANQYIITDGDITVFQSYASTFVTIGALSTISSLHNFFELTTRKIILR